MSTTKEVPKYVLDAKFINEKIEVDNDLWPRSHRYYFRTQNWSKRFESMNGVVTESDICDVIETGELYNSISNSVTFVKDIEGVAIYVVVSAKLIKQGDTYPTNPSTNDYRFNAVTLWLYIHDEELAENTGTWSESDLDQIRELYV